MSKHQDDRDKTQPLYTGGTVFLLIPKCILNCQGRGVFLTVTSKSVGVRQHAEPRRSLSQVSVCFLE